MIEYRISIRVINNKKSYMLYYKDEEGNVYYIKDFNSKYELKMYIDLIGYHISAYTTIHKINTNGYIHTKVGYYKAK